MICIKPCNTCIQDQLHATENKMGKHYPHIDLMIIVQLTYNTHLYITFEEI
jgi:hypothetical protein